MYILYSQSKRNIDCYYICTYEIRFGVKIFKK